MVADQPDSRTDPQPQPQPQPQELTLQRLALLEEQVRALQREVGGEDPQVLEAEKRSIAQRVRALEEVAATLTRQA